MARKTVTLVAGLMLAMPAFAGCLETLEMIVREHQQFNTLAIVEGDEDVAHLYYNRFDPSTLFVADMWTAPDHRKLGLMARLFESMLRREKRVDKVEAHLLMTNLDAFKGHMNDLDFLLCAALVRRTPIYKLLGAHGFRSVYDCHRSGAGVNFGVMR